MISRWSVEQVAVRKPSMRLSISQILQKVDEARDKNSKIELLRQYDNPALRTILQSCYDPRVVWLLPEGTPPYKPTNLTDLEGRLYQEAKHLYLFVEGGNPNLTPTKRQNIFIQMLESVSPEDAKVLIGCKERKLPYKSVTAKLVSEAYPGFIPMKETKK